MLSRVRCRKVRVTVTAVNRLTSTPMARVREKPFTMLAPKAFPNQYRMAEVIRVERLESRIDGQARSQPRLMACRMDRPFLSSSIRRSKISTLASTATPMLSTKPAMPGRVRVTGIRR